MGMHHNIGFGMTMSFSSSYVQTHYVLGSHNGLRTNKFNQLLNKIKLT